VAASQSVAKEMLSHGVSRLPAVTVTGYNVELKDHKGFLGDHATNRAFRNIIDQWRRRLRQVGDDPLGGKPTTKISKKKLDNVLASGDPESAALVHTAIEEFARDLAGVIHRFRKLKAWRSVQRIVVGGGLRDSRSGELVIGRAAVLLKAEGREIEVQPLHHHPDEGGLVGAVHLAPDWMFAGHDAILAVDIGGSNLRAGIVGVKPAKGSKLAGGVVRKLHLWRYADARSQPTRKDAVAQIGRMLRRLIRQATKDDLTLAPFIGIACPGVITDDGRIARGGQNLPGNWEAERFNLPAEIRGLVPQIGKHDTTVLMHNDAVVQGLSELPFVQDVRQWAVLTIGTGLGNATFTNRDR
jgi:predicted NBD/HSP70 family sugar kinase